MIFNAAQGGRRPAALSMLRSAPSGSKTRSDGYSCEAAVSSGSSPSVPALCLSMQLCPPAFTTVQGGSAFHFVNIRALYKCVSVQAVVSVAVSRIGRDTRVPSGGGPLRTLIDSELAPRESARSGSAPWDGRRLGSPSGSRRGERRLSARRRRVPYSARYVLPGRSRKNGSPICGSRSGCAGYPQIPAAHGPVSGWRPAW